MQVGSKLRRCNNGVLAEMVWGTSELYFSLDGVQVKVKESHPDFSEREFEGILRVNVAIRETTCLILPNSLIYMTIGLTLPFHLLR